MNIASNILQFSSTFLETWAVLKREQASHLKYKVIHRHVMTDGSVALVYTDKQVIKLETGAVSLIKCTGRR